MTEAVPLKDLLGEGRSAVAATADGLAGLFPGSGREGVAASLRALEEAGLAERLDDGPGGGAWLFPHGGRPRLSFSRTWSRPGSAPPDVEVAATLANPRLDDVAQLCLAYGERRVKGVFGDMVRAGEMGRKMADRVEAMLGNVHAGFVLAARGREGAGREGGGEQDAGPADDRFRAVAGLLMERRSGQDLYDTWWFLERGGRRVDELVAGALAGHPYHSADLVRRRLVEDPLPASDAGFLTVGPGTPADVEGLRRDLVVKWAAFEVERVAALVEAVPVSGPSGDGG